MWIRMAAVPPSQRTFNVDYIAWQMSSARSQLVCLTLPFVNPLNSSFDVWPEVLLILHQPCSRGCAHKQKLAISSLPMLAISHQGLHAEVVGVSHQRLHRQEPCLEWTSAAHMPTHMNQGTVISMTGQQQTRAAVAVTRWMSSLA